MNYVKKIATSGAALAMALSIGATGAHAAATTSPSASPEKSNRDIALSYAPGQVKKAPPVAETPAPPVTETPVEETPIEEPRVPQPGDADYVEPIVDTPVGEEPRVPQPGDADYLEDGNPRVPQPGDADYGIEQPGDGGLILPPETVYDGYIPSPTDPDYVYPDGPTSDIPSAGDPSWDLPGSDAPIHDMPAQEAVSGTFEDVTLYGNDGRTGEIDITINRSADGHTVIAGNVSVGYTQEPGYATDPSGVIFISINGFNEAIIVNSDGSFYYEGDGSNIYFVGQGNTNVLYNLEDGTQLYVTF